MHSQRQLRVGEAIRHALAAVFQRGDFHWPEGLSPAELSITEVRVSPDLRNATAYVMPLGGVAMPETVRALNDAVGFFRHVIADEVRLRFVPKLQFAADTSFDYATRIDTILHTPAVVRDIDAKD